MCTVLAIQQNTFTYPLLSPRTPFFLLLYHALYNIKENKYKIGGGGVIFLKYNPASSTAPLDSIVAEDAGI
jgi:hypothetical protein